jgi:hypothetical protein
MKVLIISHELWSENNNGGNVLSNLFSDFDAEFAQVYCSPGIPNNKICKRYFQITDNMIVNSLLRKQKVGRALFFEEYPYKSTNSVVSDFDESKWYFKLFKKFRFPIFETIRELLWKLAPWQTKELHDFIIDFNPDVIFAPCYGHMYMLRMDRYVKKITGTNMISYISDDSYSLRQFNLSPFYWLNRLMTRVSIKKTFRDYSLVYTMTDEQSNELTKSLGANMKVLMKGGDFSGESKKVKVNDPIRIVYAGGIYINRWKILARIGELLKQINSDRVRIRLDIYTQNEASEKQKQLLNDGQNIFLHSAISQMELREVYELSDIALHVESFELKYRLLTRLSFSTKIVDCLGSSCAVMTISWKEHAGLKYLQKENAAFCVDDFSTLHEVLLNIANNPEIIIDYANKAWKCGKRNHQIEIIRQDLYNDFVRLISLN